MITGNRGEWSEIYALFKLLGDKKIFVGDADLKKIPSIFYPIIKVLRREVCGNFEYVVKNDSISIKGDTNPISISILRFQENAKLLLKEIKKGKGTFSVLSAEKFMKEISCYSLKAKSSLKTDITVVIHDLKTYTQPSLGFSIKSQLGSPSTLLNAGETTNFTFQVTPHLTRNQIDSINKIETRSKIRDRIGKIKAMGCKLKFEKVDKTIFQNNLILVDSKLPEIVSELLVNYYFTGTSDMREVVKTTEAQNPLKFDASSKHLFYSYKIKRLLTDIALGMMPGTVWTGHYEATGGYLVVKEDGDVLCYHIYNKNEFEDYLLANTKFETASSTRHKFGRVYEEDGKTFIKLNLQIRFK